MTARQLDVTLGLRQGQVAQPRLESRSRHAAEYRVLPVSVPEDVGVSPDGSIPAAASFMLLLTHCGLMSKRGQSRSRRWKNFRSASDSNRSAGTRTSSSLPFLSFDSKNHLILGLTVPESCRVRPSKGSPFGDWHSLISARASMGN